MASEKLYRNTLIQYNRRCALFNQSGYRSMQRKLSESRSKVKWNGLFFGFVDQNVSGYRRRGSQVGFLGTRIFPIRDQDPREFRGEESETRPDLRNPYEASIKSHTCYQNAEEVLCDRSGLPTSFTPLSATTFSLDKAVWNL